MSKSDTILAVVLLCVFVCGVTANTTAYFLEEKFGSTLDEINAEIADCEKNLPSDRKCAVGTYVMELPVEGNEE